MMMKEPESIKFKAKAVVFESENGFKIIKGTAYDANTGEQLCNTSLKGQMFDVKQGDDIFASGRWDEHPQYGINFIVEAYVKIMPTDAKSILHYLSNGNIPGISKNRAKAIVKEFGEDTYHVLAKETWKLKKLKGFGEKTIEKIQIGAEKKLMEQDILSTIMRYIQGFGISPAYSKKIYNTYGLNSMQIIKTNPYKLAEEVKGIGFLKADEIALANGIAADSPFRVQSAVVYVLNKQNDDGDVFSEEDTVISQCMDFLHLDASYIKTAIKALIKNRKIIQEDVALYPAALYYAEKKSAEKLVKLTKVSGKNIHVTKEEIQQIGRLNGTKYAAEQIQAVLTTCSSNVMILTGGPGTGKTTTVNAIIQVFKKHGMKIHCAAPTGKAAKRMSEVTHVQAQTIHKLLEVKSDKEYGFKFGRNEKNPLEGDALIIDESSMIDMQLLYAILKAVPVSMKLIFVGDIDQLPSVGCGNVLHEMINSKVIPVVKLTEIFRQAQKSAIVRNAHYINQGIIPEFKNQKDGDYFFMDVDGLEQEQIRDWIVEYAVNKLPSFYHVNPEEVQVLAPMKRGHTGVEELNNFIQAKINPVGMNKPIMVANGRIIRQGDKVMFTCNDYDKEVFNGDIGKVVYISCDNNEDESCDETASSQNVFIVDFDGRRVVFDKTQASDFVLAYATTIHKSQGSEYDIVVMPLTNANYVMLQRNLLYTGITRAKKIFVLFGQKKAVARAVQNLTVINRKTRLAVRIQESNGLFSYIDNNAK